MKLYTTDHKTYDQLYIVPQKNIYSKYRLSSGVERLIIDNRISIDDIESLLFKWWNYDWGENPEEDNNINKRSLDSWYITHHNHLDVLGVYHINDIKLWIFASYEPWPTVLLPKEY